MGFGTSNGREGVVHFSRSLNRWTSIAIQAKVGAGLRAFLAVLWGFRGVCLTDSYGGRDFIVPEICHLGLIF